MAIWEKQPWEDDQTYRVFHRWLLMDGDRDIHEAYRLETGRKYTTGGHLVVAPQAIIRASNGYYDDQIAWAERASAFDAEEKRKEMRWWVKQRDKIRKTEFELSFQLFERAKEMLEWPIYQDEIEDTEDGTTIIRKPARWAMRDVQAMVKVGSEISRLSAEMEQSIHKFVLTLTPEAMRAVEILENYGVNYSDVVQNFERILIETARKYQEQDQIVQIAGPVIDGEWENEQ